MYDNTYICQKLKNWLKEKEEEEEKEKEKEEEEEKNSQLSLPAAAASFFAACLLGKNWFLEGKYSYLFLVPVPVKFFSLSKLIMF